MLLAERRGLPVTMHTPTEVKAAVSGSGRADKAQVTAMVTRLLGLDKAPRPADAADALALAICHVWRGSVQNRLAEAAAAHGSKPSGIPSRATRRPATGNARAIPPGGRATTTRPNPGAHRP
jgi:crossover junction endodeoxyribonuclease RuvC